MSIARVFESWSDEAEGVVGIHSSDGKVVISGDAEKLLNFLRYSPGLKVAYDLD